jgi:hypothetical protein
VELVLPTGRLGGYSTYIHTYIHTHTHTYIHTYIHTHTHTHIHTYIHTYIHTHTHTYTHIHTHTYTHTHIYTFHGSISVSQRQQDVKQDKNTQIYTNFTIQNTINTSQYSTIDLLYT